MDLNYPDSITLLSNAKKHDLYHDLLQQLHKDFKYANVHLALEDEAISPGFLLQELYQIVYHLLNSNFSDYLNLLYIVDVSEKQVKNIKSEDPLEIAKYVTFLILKREWQKIWFRNKYS